MGFSFIWTKSHKDGTDLEPLRQIGDPDCDVVMAFLHKYLKIQEQDALGLCRKLAKQHIADSRPDSEILYPSDECCLCYEFIQKYSTIPTWVNWASILDGQQFFTRCIVPALISLLYFTLISGFGAPKLSKVLASTGYLSNGCAASYRRLLETDSMIITCLTGTISTLEPNHIGWQSCLRVRLLHARIRYMLLNEQHGGIKWDTAEFGIPINQEDLLVTLMGFSFSVLFSFKERMYIRFSTEEEQGYLHVWRYMGWLLGIDDHFNSCETYDKARTLTESILHHIGRPDETSCLLAHQVIKAIAIYLPIPARFEFHSQMVRKLAGDVWADALKLPPGNRLFSFIIEIKLPVFRLVSWLGRNWQHDLPKHAPLIEQQSSLSLLLHPVFLIKYLLQTNVRPFMLKSNAGRVRLLIRNEYKKIRKHIILDETAEELFNYDFTMHKTYSPNLYITRVEQQQRTHLSSLTKFATTSKTDQRSLIVLCIVITLIILLLTI
ncbi:unnamed protein product [Didymodactylos carnosus]|uniref:ER-bound oxygenase mpaB/mpaB'/Rubber oxygenase catalytic domain-containing protein n=1 Tax=Didymodactylos carnosus TaxID=1234261 RepID=A0A8S2UJG8_9BILA|nr:unnamed protein product [Didymodactylos carnosus]CAF4484235.1 unnamed protein product [Didymodactylos carnosus]